jgi:hypothetical protein
MILTEQQKKRIAKNTKLSLSNVVQKSLDTFNKGKDCVKAAKDAAKIAKFVKKIAQDGKATKDQLAKLAVSTIQKSIEDEANKGLKQAGELLKKTVKLLPDNAEIKIELASPGDVGVKDLAKSLYNANFVLDVGGVQMSAGRKSAGVSAKSGNFTADVKKDFQGGTSANIGYSGTFQEQEEKHDMPLIMENWRKFLHEACWEGYKQVGMKNKGGKKVPNCVPMEEEVRDTYDDEVEKRNDASRARGKAALLRTEEEMPCNQPKRTPSHPKKSHIVLACKGGKKKTIRFGQQGVKTNQTAGQRKAFKSRHAKNIAKGKMSAAYWADKVKWSPAKTKDKDNEKWVKGS